MKATSILLCTALAFGACANKHESKPAPAATKAKSTETSHGKKHHHSKSTTKKTTAKKAE
jgi:hypothetical protein